MINLIPPSAKRKIAVEYWTRVFSVGIIFISGILATATLLLLPVYVRIHSQINVYEDSAAQALGKVAEYDLSSATLINTGVRARLLLDLQQDIALTDIVETLQALQNNQITIDNISINRTPEGIDPVDISGKALTRQALANFRESLLNHPDIESAFLPISNLAQDRNISFNVTVTMKPD